MHAARRVVQRQHKTHREQRALGLAKQILNRLFEQADRVSWKQQPQRIHDRFRFQRRVREHTQHKNHRREKGQKQAKRNGCSPGRDGPVHQTDQKEPQHVVDVHAFLAPRLKRAQKRLRPLHQTAPSQPLKEGTVWQTHPCKVEVVFNDKSKLLTLCVSAPIDTKSTPASP